MPPPTHSPTHTPQISSTSWVKKGGWTVEEDELLRLLVKEFGPRKWAVIASHLPGRVDKQCRER